VLQSKCGIRFGGDPDEGSPHRFDFSYEHILRSVEGILERLKTDYLDILLLHRPDPLVEPEEVAKAFDELHQSGKVRYFGVSNHTPSQISLLKRFLNQPLVANQVELNVIHSHLLDAGVVFNQDKPSYPVRGEGAFEYCREHDISVQAWSPLALGAVTGKIIDPADDRLASVARLVRALAEQKRVSPEAILIAWLLRIPGNIQPVIGTTNLERIRASCQGLSVTLSREEWYLLFTAGRGAPLLSRFLIATVPETATPWTFFRGLAMFTLIDRSPIVFSLNMLMAFSASAWLLIVTKAKPLALPVSRSLMISTDSTAPASLSKCAKLLFSCRIRQVANIQFCFHYLNSFKSCRSVVK
jgi:predicted oxidoreductase